MNRIVVLGAGYAGMIAALRIDRKADVTVVDGRDRFVQRIRTHQVMAGQNVRQPLIRDLLRRDNIRFVQGWAHDIDLDAQVVSVRTSAGDEALAYDVLVYALGSRVTTNGVPGVAEHAYTVDPSGERSVVRLRADLPAMAARGDTVAVVGGGLTGIETATELAEQYPGLRVQLLSRSAIGPDLSAKGQQHLARVFAKLGIDALPRMTVSRVEADAIVTTDGQRLPVDATIWAGAFAVAPLARDAGLLVDSRNRVLVGPDLRSRSHPNVFAIGDAAAVVEKDGAVIRMACATALPLGAHAADNVTALLHGKPLAAFGFHYWIQCISLGRHEALVQLVDSHDRPLERVITGRLGVMIKEMICWSTVAALGWERRWQGVYAWPGRNAKPELAPAVEGIAQHG